MKGTLVLPVAILVVVVGAFLLLVPVSFGSSSPATVVQNDFQLVSGPGGSFDVATLRIDLPSTPYGFGSDSISVTWSISGGGQPVSAGLYTLSEQQTKESGENTSALAVNPSAATSGTLSSANVSPGQDLFALFFLPPNQNSTNLTASWTGVQSFSFGSIGAGLLVLGLILFLVSIVFSRPHPSPHIEPEAYHETTVPTPMEVVPSVPPPPVVVPINPPVELSLPISPETYPLPSATVEAPPSSQEAGASFVAPPLLGPAPPAIVRCPQCGSSMPEGSAPCRMCGYVPEARATPPPVPSPTAPPVEEPGVKSAPSAPPSPVPAPLTPASPSFIAGPSGSPRGIVLPSAHEELQRRCPSCRLGIPEASWYFCPRCGTEVPEDA